MTINLVDSGTQIQRLLSGAQAPISLTREIEPSSTLTFVEYTGAIGSTVRGMFSILFKSGRTLAGDFEGLLEDALPQG